MKSINNQVVMKGNLGTDIQITQTEKGFKVARFSLAQNTFKKDESGKKSWNTTWYRMFAWGNMATTLETNLKKGQSLFVSGRLVNRTYINRKGTPRKITEVEVQSFAMV